MKATFAAAGLCCALAGCSMAPIALDVDRVQRYPVPASKVVVEDISTLPKIKAGDMVWVNGWVPIYDGFAPPLNDAFAQRVRAAIVPNGDGPATKVTIVGVGLFMEKNASDDMAFVNLFTAGRSRGFKCTADISISTSDSAKRVQLEHAIKRPYFDTADQLREFVDSCQDQLLQELQGAVARMAALKQDQSQDRT